MTKAQLIAGIAKEAELTQAAAQKALETITKCIAVEVKAGRSIALPGLGSFNLAKRAARKGRNPRTGAEIKIPASKTVRFKASSVLKDKINK